MNNEKIFFLFRLNFILFFMFYIYSFFRTIIPNSLFIVLGFVAPILMSIFYLYFIIKYRSRVVDLIVAILSNLGLVVFFLNLMNYFYKGILLF